MSVCTHPSYPKSRCRDCGEQSWLCANCEHRLYEHGHRKEPSSGKRYYAACGIEGCPCMVGANRLYPRGLIDS